VNDTGEEQAYFAVMNAGMKHYTKREQAR